MYQAEVVRKQWLDQEDLDEILRKELMEIEDPDDLNDRFYRDLEFGTGGLRGVLGAGTNRMNIYTVRRATQGFADYINLHYKQGGDCFNGSMPSVAVAYDSRINSDLFAAEAACVLAANGIKAFVYPELMPTPALSFAVRYYRCCAGIMVTASHNPSKYNGYKVYGDDGCQLTLEAAAEVLSMIEKVDLFKGVKTLPGGYTLEHGIIKPTSEDPSVQELIQMIPPTVTEAYLFAVKNESSGIDCADLSVVYTPLNGAGNRLVKKIMKMIGVAKVYAVREQELPDGNFPTCPYPNPEKKEALSLGLELCQKLSEEGAPPDLLLATDPDCDRVGIAVLHRDSETGTKEYQLISGNETGVLLLDYICHRRGKATMDKMSGKEQKEHEFPRPMPKDALAIKTIVTTKMAEKIAKFYGVEIIDVLTGFKFIGEQIRLLEEKGEEHRYIFGFEESYGYLAGTYVRDKDAVSASMLICEMTAYYKNLGKTLVDRLKELYEKYGYYRNDLMEFTFEGSAGMEKMNHIMRSFREEAPARFAGKKVTEIADYKLSVRRIIGGGDSCDLVAGSKPIRLPKSDVLEFVLEDGSSIIVRPSGTEPKLKIYLSAKGNSNKDSLEIIEALQRELEQFLN